VSHLADKVMRGELIFESDFDTRFPILNINAEFHRLVPIAVANLLALVVEKRSNLFRGWPVSGKAAIFARLKHLLVQSFGLTR
jgi:hypothetical protein